MSEAKYCFECGTGLPGGAKFCPECGQSQGGSAPPRSTLWEHAAIRVEKVKQRYVRDSLFRYIVDGRGPSGHRVVSTLNFEAFAGGGIRTFDYGNAGVGKAQEALGTLTQTLLRDGWEQLPDTGEGFWELRFRRPVQ